MTDPGFHSQVPPDSFAADVASSHLAALPQVIDSQFRLLRLIGQGSFGLTPFLHMFPFIYVSQLLYLSFLGAIFLTIDAQKNKLYATKVEVYSLLLIASFPNLLFFSMPLRLAPLPFRLYEQSMEDTENSLEHPSRKFTSCGITKCSML
jgi:hypothetical protein